MYIRVQRCFTIFIIAAVLTLGFLPSRTVAAEPPAVENSLSANIFTSSKFDYSFGYSITEAWSLPVESEMDDEIPSFVTLSNKNTGELITIEVSPKSDHQNTLDWLKSTFYRRSSDLTAIDKLIFIGTYKGILLTQPQTCRTVAMLSVVFTTENLAFSVNYFAPQQHSGLSNYHRLLESFRLSQAQAVKNFVPELEFPASKKTTCSISAPLSSTLTSLATPNICPGASFYIPAEGSLMTPYGCWIEAPWCSSYNPNASNSYFHSPHRGLDIGPIGSNLYGNGTPGVIDIYAPADGFVGSTSSQSVFINHPGPNVSTYYAHMRDSSTGASYVYITPGTNVVGGQTVLGKMGNWSGTLGQPLETHLHFSILRYGGSDAYYSDAQDPTPFLQAQDLVFYSGWNRHSMACIGFPAAPANQNLVRNSNFSDGSNEWNALGDVDWQAVNGVLYFQRNAGPLGFASVYQDLNYNVNANSPFDVHVDLKNRSAVTKQATVVLHDTDGQGGFQCTFTLQPNTAFQTYWMRGRTNVALANIRFEIYLGPADGIPDVAVDNVSVQYQPGITSSQTLCTAPANQNLVRNSNFSDGSNEWNALGDVDWQAVNGVLYFQRNAGPLGFASVYQDLNYNVIANSSFDVHVDLKNRSAVTKQATVVLHDTVGQGGFQCAFTLQPNTAFQTYWMRGRTNVALANIRFEIYLDPADGIPDVAVDNVSVQFQPASSFSITECLSLTNHSLYLPLIQK
jgi:hypothetical protein